MILKLSFFEIYNDVISDLLSEGVNSGLKLKEAGPLILISGLSEHQVTSESEAFNMYKQALVNRKVEETVKNLMSSRSHAVFQVKLYSKDDLNSTN